MCVGACPDRQRLDQSKIGQLLGGSLSTCLMLLRGLELGEIGLRRGRWGPIKRGSSQKQSVAGSAPLAGRGFGVDLLWSAPLRQGPAIVAGLFAVIDGAPSMGRIPPVALPRGPTEHHQIGIDINTRCGGRGGICRRAVKVGSPRHPLID